MVCARAFRARGLFVCCASHLRRVFFLLFPDIGCRFAIRTAGRDHLITRSRGHVPTSAAVVYVCYATLNAACRTLGIHAEYAFGCYAVRGGCLSLTGQYYRPPFLCLFPAIICGFLSKRPISVSKLRFIDDFGLYICSCQIF